MSTATSAGHPLVRHGVTIGVPLLVIIIILHQPILSFLKRTLLAHSSSLSTLSTALQDPDYHVRLTAVEALGKLTAAADQVAPLYLQALGDTDDEVSAQALAAAKARALAPEVLVAAADKMLQDPAAPGRAAAARAVCRYAPTAPTAVPLWLKALLAPETEVRLPAVQALAKVGSSDASTEAGRALVAALGSPKLYVRKEAAITLGQLGEAGAKAAGPLTDLAVRDKETRRFALRALIKIGPGAVPPLAAAWEKNQGELLDDLGMALGNLAAHAKSLAPLMERYADAADAQRRHSADGLLVAIDPVRALAVFTRLADHATPAIRSDAISTLGSLGKDAAPALAVLIKHLDDDDKQVRFATINALGSIGPPAIGAKAKLEKFLKDPDEGTRKSAQGAIQLITAK